MKHIQIFILLFISGFIQAQTMSGPSGYGQKINNLSALDFFRPPVLSDTVCNLVVNATNGDCYGAIVILRSNNKMYRKDSSSWKEVGAGAGNSGIVDTVQSISSMQSYAGTAAAIFVTEPLRGGWFFKTSSGSPDGGIIFSGVGGVWNRGRIDLRMINIGWFTGEPDGVTDLTSVIQGAVTKYQRDGAKFYFPTTTQFSTTNKFYRTTGTLTIDSTNVMFYSDGNTETGVAFIKNTNPGTQMIVVNSDIFSFVGMGLLGDGGVLLAPVPTVNGILINGNSAGNADADIRNSEFFLLNRSVSIKARNVNIYDNIFSNSRFGIYVDSIKVGGEMRGFFIMRNRFHTVGKFQLTDACVYSSTKGNFAFDIQNNYADGQGNSVFALLKAAKEVTIRNNEVVLNRSNFVSLDSCNGFDISSNYFAWNTGLPTTSTPTININGARYGSISNNIIKDSPREAIYFYGSTATNNNISNNTIVDFSEDTISMSAIRLTSGSTRNSVTNNVIFTTSTGFTPGIPILNENNLNTVFANLYYPQASLGRPANIESNTNYRFINTDNLSSSIQTVGTTSGVKKLTVQAGEALDSAGGAINLYGNAHATYPGQVRIGLSSNPASKFVVNKGGLGETASGDIMSIFPSGGVAIGRPAAGSVLDVGGDIRAATPTGGSAYWIAGLTNGNRWGIGTINPTESAGDVGADFMLSSYNNAGTRKDTIIVVNRATGFVGIGKTPSYKLDVSNSINGFTELSTDNSTRVATTAWVRTYGIANQLVSAQTGNLWVSGVARSGSVSIQSVNPSISMVDGVNPNVVVQMTSGRLDFNSPTVTSFSGTSNLGVGTVTPNSKFSVVGSVSFGLRTITAATTLDATDYYVNINNTSNIIVTLPSAVNVAGRTYVVKKVSNNVNTITFNTTSSQTIDGGASGTLIIVAYNNGYTFYSDGANWFIKN